MHCRITLGIKLNMIYTFLVLLISCCTIANSFNVAIIGTGPAGALAAISLAKKGHTVNVFDQQSVESKDETCQCGVVSQKEDDSRNYNLVLNKRGIDALDRFGVKYSDKSVTIKQILAHRHDVAWQKQSLETISISRSDLVACIKDAAKDLDITFHHSKLITVDFDSRIAFLENRNQYYDLLIGADGSNSKVRSALRSCNKDFDYDEIVDDRVFKTFKVTKEELSKMKGYDETWGSSFHIWQADDSELICPPSIDGGLTVSYVTKKEFKMGNFPDFNLGEFRDKSIEMGRPRVTKSVYCTHVGLDNVILMGDSCHSMIPSLGAGVNAALEDSVYLDACCSTKESPSVDEIVTSYNNIRLRDSHAVTKLSQIGFGNSDRSNRGNVHAAMKYIGNSDISYSEILDIVESNPEIPEV